VLSGCGKKAAPSPPVAQNPAPSAQVSASAEPPLPPDHALPGELAEGPEDAFGIRIPRRMTITGRFRDAVFATGAIAPEHVANYVRRRVNAEQVETGEIRTFFKKATPMADPSHVLSIEIIDRNGTTDLLIRDKTPPPRPSSVVPEPDGEEAEFGHLLDGGARAPKPRE